MTSPTQRTLAHARSLGFKVAVTEKYNRFAKVRQDLYGGIDVLACKRGVGIVGIQACAGASHAARATKLRLLLADADSALSEFVAAGGRVEVWSFAIRGKRGRRKKYELRREELTTTRHEGE